MTTNFLLVYGYFASALLSTDPNGKIHAGVGW